MSSDTKQQVMISSRSVLGNYFSNRPHAIKEDLESFKAFLILLKYQYRDRVEIPRTVIKLLHMYHPQDGYEAYMKLVKIICVLLEELDQDILKYLLSIIPPPNLYGTCDVNSMKEEVREITGFSLLSTPAFHTWVLPVLKNNSGAKQKENKPETQSSNQAQTSYPIDDVKPDVQTNKNEETNTIPDFPKITTNVNSDNESVISEPKLENYDLYEIVGDLSKTILSQLSSKPDCNMTAYNRMRNFFDLEAVMTPSALRPPNVGDGDNEDKQIALSGGGRNKPFTLDDFVVDPILEKSMKDFIARAYGLLPSISSGDNVNDKQAERRIDTGAKSRRRIEQGSKTKHPRQPKRKKTLLDELTRPQKKSLLSYLITPLDPITDNSSENTGPPHADGQKADGKRFVGDIKKKKKSPIKKSPRSNAEEIVPVVESKEAIAPKGVDNVASVPATNVNNEPASEILTREVVDEVSITRCAPEITSIKKETAEVTAVEETQSFMKEELSSCSMDISFTGKDLEWSRENMKLFGITVTDDDICANDSQIKDIQTNDENNKPPLPAANATAKEHALPPNPQGNSSFKSVAPKEYLQFPSDLTVTKYNVPVQPKETAFPLPVADNKERPQPVEQRKPVIENCQNELTVPKFEPCGPATSQAMNPSMRNWQEYTGAMFDPQHAMNVQRRRNLSLGFPGNATRIRHYVSQGAPMNNMQGPGLAPSSISSSYESMYPFPQDWMMKSANSTHPVPPPSWGPFPAHYGQNPNFRDMAQQRTRLVQRATFLQQAPPAVNNYMNPGHALMMNNMWGSYPSVRSGLFTRAGDMPPMLPTLPHPLYPMTDPMRQQQQHMRNISQGMMQNYAASQANAMPQPPLQNKRRKLEEIVGRLKEAEKGT